MNIRFNTIEIEQESYNGWAVRGKDRDTGRWWYLVSCRGSQAPEWSSDYAHAKLCSVTTAARLVTKIFDYYGM